MSTSLGESKCIQSFFSADATLGREPLHTQRPQHSDKKLNLHVNFSTGNILQVHDNNDYMASSSSNSSSSDEEDTCHQDSDNENECVSGRDERIVKYIVDDEAPVPKEEKRIFLVTSPQNLPDDNMDTDIKDETSLDGDLRGDSSIESNSLSIKEIITQTKHILDEIEAESTKLEANVDATKVETDSELTDEISESNCCEVKVKEEDGEYEEQEEEGHVTPETGPAKGSAEISVDGRTMYVVQMDLAENTEDITISGEEMIDFEEPSSDISQNGEDCEDGNEPQEEEHETKHGKISPEEGNLLSQLEEYLSIAKKDSSPSQTFTDHNINESLLPFPVSYPKQVDLVVSPESLPSFENDYSSQQSEVYQNPEDEEENRQEPWALSDYDASYPNYRFEFGYETPPNDEGQEFHIETPLPLPLNRCFDRHFENTMENRILTPENEPFYSNNNGNIVDIENGNGNFSLGEVCCEQLEPLNYVFHDQALQKPQVPILNEPGISQTSSFYDKNSQDFVKSLTKARRVLSLDMNIDNAFEQLLQLRQNKRKRSRRKVYKAIDPNICLDFPTDADLSQKQTQSWRRLLTEIKEEPGSDQDNKLQRRKRNYTDAEINLMLQALNTTTDRVTDSETKTNLEDHIESRLELGNDCKKTETRLPFKKRRMVLNENEDKELPEISYPATPMLCIAEIASTALRQQNERPGHSEMFYPSIASSSYEVNPLALTMKMNANLHYKTYESEQKFPGDENDSNLESLMIAMHVSDKSNT